MVQSESQDAVSAMKADMAVIKGDIASIKHAFASAAVDIRTEIQELKKSVAVVVSQVEHNRNLYEMILDEIKPGWRQPDQPLV